LWLNANGKLIAQATGTSSVSNKSLAATVTSVQSTNSLATNKWSFVTVVVDCIEGVVELYVNGRNSGKLDLNNAQSTSSAAAGHVDSAWSLGDQFTLFGTRSQIDCGNGAIR
jgi:hypothetical protein